MLIDYMLHLVRIYLPVVTLAKSRYRCYCTFQLRIYLSTPIYL